MPLYAYRGDTERKYLKLFQGALSEARKQLPSDRNCAICVAGLAMHTVEEVIQPQIANLHMPSNICFVSAWEGDTFRLWADDAHAAFLTSLLGPLFAFTA
jgi:hypothetical protein